MSERPILFSSGMVRAILEGRKTQTRRVVRKSDRGEIAVSQNGTPVYVTGAPDDDGEPIPCPYSPGDRLWVRETWAPLGDQLTEVIGRPRVFRAEADLVRDDSGDRVGWWLGETFLEGSERPFRWRPSLHMPRWASRISLDIVSVRVERLQAITEADAFAEGVEANPYVMCDGTTDEAMSISARDNFRTLWDTINGKRPGCSWADNPWVWAVSFRRLEAERWPVP